MQRRNLERARRFETALEWLWCIAVTAVLAALCFMYIRDASAASPKSASPASPYETEAPEAFPLLLSEAENTDVSPCSTGVFSAKSESTDEPEEFISADAFLVPLAEISTAKETSPEPAADVDPAELDLLSRLIYAEAGCSWIPDEIQLAVGSVVLNRVASPYFPDTLRDVIYSPGQYGCAMTGAIEQEADERTIENARTLLTSGSVLPSNVVFQAEFKQGDGVYMTYEDEILGTTTYFCTYGEEDVIK